MEIEMRRHDFKIGDMVRTKKTDNIIKTCQLFEPRLAKCKECGIFKQMPMEIVKMNNDNAYDDIVVKVKFKPNCDLAVRSLSGFNTFSWKSEAVERAYKWIKMK